MNIFLFSNCRTNANDAGRSPSPVCTFKGGSHGISIASAVKTVVHAPLRQFACNVLLDGLGECSIIDTVDRFEHFGQLELFGIDIYSNDTTRPLSILAP